jgi:hypothetical protein
MVTSNISGLTEIRTCNENPYLESILPKLVVKGMRLALKLEPGRGISGSR